MCGGYLRIVCFVIKRSSLAAEILLLMPASHILHGEQFHNFIFIKSTITYEVNYRIE